MCKGYICRCKGASDVRDTCGGVRARHVRVICGGVRAIFGGVRARATIPFTFIHFYYLPPKLVRSLITFSVLVY